MWAWTPKSYKTNAFNKWCQSQQMICWSQKGTTAKLEQLGGMVSHCITGCDNMRVIAGTDWGYAHTLHSANLRARPSAPVHPPRSRTAPPCPPARTLAAHSLPGFTFMLLEWRPPSAECSRTVNSPGFKCQMLHSLSYATTRS